MPDREKYIEVLSKAVKTVKESNEDAPIKISLDCIEDILELLKEQESVVRCKDCRNAIVYDGIEVVCTHIDSNGNDKHTADWFCADGERFGDSEQL